MDRNQGTTSWSRQRTPAQVCNDARNASLHLLDARQWDFSQLQSVGKLTLTSGPSPRHALYDKMVKRTLQSMEKVSLGESSPPVGRPACTTRCSRQQTMLFSLVNFFLLLSRFKNCYLKEVSPSKLCRVGKEASATQTTQSSLALPYGGDLTLRTAGALGASHRELLPPSPPARDVCQEP